MPVMFSQMPELRATVPTARKMELADQADSAVINQ